MALTDNTTYYGKDAEGFYMKALQTGVAKTTLKLIPNAKDTVKLAYSDLGNIIQDAGCSWSNSGEGSINQKSMSVCRKQIQLEYCADTFWNNYLGERMRAGLNTGEIMPADYASFIANQVMDVVSQDLELAIFAGDSATSSYPYSICDGLVKQMQADSAVIDVSATSSTLSSSNVVTEFQRIYSASPAKVKKLTGYAWFISEELAEAYKLAQAATTGGLFMVGDKELNYLGIKLIPTPGLSGKQAIAGPVGSKAFFLTDLMSDAGQIDIINMRKTTGVNSIRMTGSFAFGVNYLYGNEFVLYA